VISKLPFVLLAIAAVVIAVATLVEDAGGTEYAYNLIYGSLWFKLLWGAVVISGLYVIFKRKMWRRPMLLMLHLSFVIILTGALITSLTSMRGTMHLREGIPCADFISEEHKLERLPFMVRLDKFELVCYPGTEAPQDYKSSVTIEGKQQQISMNHIGKAHGYRFYQTSFDEDLQGTVLSVNYDPWGTGITYLGYALLGLSMMINLLPKRKKGATSIPKAFLLLLLLHANTITASVPAIPAEKAHSIEREQVMWNDRVAPVGTMSQELLLKIYGKRKYHGLSSTQVIASMILEPAAWSKEPIIKVSRGEYKSLTDFVDYSSGTPRLQNLDQNDMNTAEKVGLMVMLMQGDLVKEVPVGVKRLSSNHVRIELFYNSIDWTLIGFICCFILAPLSLLKKGRKIRIAYEILHGLLFAFLLLSFMLRWYIAGRVPLSNGYETLLFVSLCFIATSWFIQHRWLALLMAAFSLLVAHLGEMNPQITPLMPVLHSPWLSAHVSIIMISYALLAISIVERRLLRLAVFMLSAGIFLGAIWANVSWGSYWSWDPKESWALVTLIIYSIPLHTESMPWFRSNRNYRLYSLLALASLLMTYFGVNYLLSGMHSYANG